MKFLMLFWLLYIFLPAQGQFVVIGFQPMEYCVVEDDYVEICIEILAAGAIREFLNVNVDNQAVTRVVALPANLPVGGRGCFMFHPVDNACLDSGSSAHFLIRQPLPAGVFVAQGCDKAHVEIFDDEVIEFGIKNNEDIIYADEGDSSVEVCVRVTCVNGPTKRGAPILFIVPPVSGIDIADLQKEVVLIPKGTENGDKVCADIEINSLFDVTPGQGFVDIPVHVLSQDPSVLGSAYATVRVHSDGFTMDTTTVTMDTTTDPPTDGPCDVCFIDGTPEVTGNDIRIRLPSCVMTARCTLPGIDVSCNGQVDTILTTPRNTYLSLGVSVTEPWGASPTSLTRRLRIDETARCDSHLINKGFVHDFTGTHTLEFEGTGGTGGPITTFYCTVESPIGTPIVPQAACATPAYTFMVPAGTTTFYVTVVPHPPTGIMCSNTHVRVYHYQAPDIIIEP